MTSGAAARRTDHARGVTTVVNPSALLLGQAPWSVMGPVLDRLDPRTRTVVLGTGGLPTSSLVSYVLDRGSPDDRTALAGNPDADRHILTGLAVDPPPDVVRALLVHPHANRETLLPLVPLLPRGTPVPSAVADRRTQRSVYLQIESPDPALVADALTALRMDPQPFPGAGTVAVRACLNLWRLAGRDAARAALAGIPQPDGPNPHVLTALDALDQPDGRQILGRTIQRDGHTIRLLTGCKRMRGTVEHGREPGGLLRLLLLAPHGGPLDWTYLREQHARAPFTTGLLAALREQPDCPHDFDPPPEQGAPPGTPGRSKSQRRRAREQATAALRDLTVKYHRDVVRAAYAANLVSPLHVLIDGVTASGALSVFETATGRALNDARSVVSSLTKDTLEDRTEAWMVALHLLPTFHGTLTELLHTARAATT